MKKLITSKFPGIPAGNLRMRDSREFPGIPELKFPVALHALRALHAFEWKPGLRLSDRSKTIVTADCTLMTILYMYEVL